MKRILIVEDEKNIAEIERDYLELDGFEVIIENNGANGQQRALKEDFDLVILDIMLPDMDGFEICRSLRKEKDVPILMVTAKVSSIDKVRGLGIGADDYIVKPFDPAELVARVKVFNRRLVAPIASCVFIKGDRSYIFIHEMQNRFQHLHGIKGII